VLDLAPADLTTAAPENVAAVGWGLARLRRTHAEVLEAFYFDGKSVREIASEYGTSERAIEGRLRRAREKLRKQLQRVMRPLNEAHHAAPTRTT
jgi:DNA-directed RNA polymerase specialized sigma24 family protein